MKSYDFTVKSIEEIVAFKGTQKNDVNMFCESDAPRLAIYISLGHRDNIFFFQKFIKIQKSSKQGSRFIGKKFLKSFWSAFYS